MAYIVLDPLISLEIGCCVGDGTRREYNTITVPIANHDNNQHSSNENIRLQNLWGGIETMAALMRMEGLDVHFCLASLLIRPLRREVH